MSPLRRSIAAPALCLTALFLAFALVGVDAARSPQAQIASRWYVDAVRTYQQLGHPIANRLIRCRFQPTCSEYSIQAVQKYGLARGLVLTVRRLASCRGSVKLGTPDPLA